MSEENGQYEIDVADWYAVCDAEDVAQAVFPTENLALWYLGKYSWGKWKVRQIAGKSES